MNGIQLENGHTRIANQLLEKLSKVSMGGNCWRVLIAIIRKLYGFRKKEDWIEYSQLMKITGMRKQRVSESVIELRKIGIVTQKRDGIRQILALNKDFLLVTQKRDSNGKASTTVTEKRTTKESIQKKYILAKAKNMNTYNEDRGYEENKALDEDGNPIGVSKKIHGANPVRVQAEQFLKFYTAKYKKLVGDDIPYYPKSAYLKQVKPVLEKYPIDKLEGLLLEYFKANDDYIKQSKWAVWTFLSWKVLNRLNK